MIINPKTPTVSRANHRCIIERAAAIVVGIVIVRVDVPLPLSDAGLNEHVPPAGNPVQLRLTVPALCAVTAAVNVALFPRAIVADAGVTDIDSGAVPVLAAGEAANCTIAVPNVVEPVAYSAMPHALLPSGSGDI
jgi:hypothetical protein